jgi:hypothetical protein
MKNNYFIYTIRYINNTHTMAYLMELNSERYVDLNEKMVTEFLPIYDGARYVKLSKMMGNITDKWNDIKCFNSRDFDLQKSLLEEWYGKNFPQFMKSNITSIKNLQELIMAFYNDEIWGTTIHVGPLNKETEFILPELKEFVKKGIIPIDSEPCLIFDDYLQKPYIELLIPRIMYDKFIHNIKNKAPYIGIVPYKQMQITKYYPNFTEDIVSCMLGFDLDVFLKFFNGNNQILFSNKFFTDLLDCIDNDS